MIEDGQDILIELFTSMENLKVLYFKGNPVGRKISNYRRVS